MKAIPQMFVGPFNGWTPYYKDRSTATFSTIAQNLNNQKHEELIKLAYDLPDKSFFFGICDHARIMTLDGTHRSTAITLAGQAGLDIKPNVQIALAYFDRDNQVLFDQIFDTIIKSKTLS